MSDNVEETNSKKQKLDEVNLLKGFEFVKTLSENSLNKVIMIQANKKADDDKDSSKDDNRRAVIIFDKPAFSQSEVAAFLQGNDPHETQLNNDVYNKFCIFPSRPFNNVQVQLIYPATDAHIAKYSAQEMFLLSESYQDWLDITYPKYITNSLHLQWVFNILEHKTESERILFEDADPLGGFILLPDMKWNGNAETLYMLAIVHRRDLLSLRSLTAEHIGLLEHIRDASMDAIGAKYAVPKHKLRAYVHYQPSFFHFHVHFTHIAYQAPGMPERNVQLNHIIENLKVDSAYYQKVALECVVKKNEKLYELYKSRFE